MEAKKSTTRWINSCGLVLLLVIPTVSLAAEGVEKNEVKLESIIVTANKIAEDIKDVPQSITVIDEAAIEEKGIENIADIIEEIPNLTTQPNHGQSVNFRGLNVSLFTNANPVVLYIDGVAVVDRYGYESSLADVERLEVLRGPQGTLYGRDAIGGVINIVTKEPENQWQGKLGVEYGSYNSIYSVARAAGSLIEDTLYAGFSGQYAGTNGWIENVHGGANDDEAAKKEDRRFNGYLLYKPSNRFKARLTLSNEFSENHAEEGYALPGGADLSEFSRDGAEHINVDFPSREEIDINSQNLNITYDFGEMTMTAVTSHRVMDMNGLYDADYANNPLYKGLFQYNDTETDTWSQEIRLSSNKEGGVRWVGGIYVDAENRKQGPYGMDFPNFDPTTFTFLGNYGMNAESEADSRTYAAFGQATIPLGERFELTLGGRYQHIEKDIDLDMYYLPVGMSGPAMFSLDGDKSWDAFLPKGALSYKINGQWTTYASFSQGYMPGGFNFFSTSGTIDDNSFDPQRSTNYEIGLKGGYDQFRFGASLFYMDIRDIHVYKSVSSSVWICDNADQAHSLGAEFDFSYWLTDTIELSGAAGIIEAEYDDYDAGGGITFDGEKLESTPSHSLRFGVAWFHPLGFYSRAEVYNQGDLYFYDGAGTKMVKADGRTTIDARVGYHFNDWDLYVYGKNLFDEEYVNSFISNSTLSVAGFGEPRTFGMGLRYRF